MRRVLTPTLVCIMGATLLAQAASIVRYEQVTVANSSIGFTAGLINVAGIPATQASCRLETAEIRFRYDGGAPTTTVGTPLEPGDVLEIKGADLIAAFRAIRTGASSGVLNCHYVTP